MASSNDSPQRLYLMQLSTTTLPRPNGPPLAMSSGCYLVQTTDGKNVLIDTGLPAEYTPPPGTPPAETSRTVLEHLDQLGLRPDAISMLICTHFDVDHAGNHDEFPQAELVVQREHLELARSGHPRFAGARPHWDHPALRYRIVEGDVELLPGLALIETSGHVPGHQSVLVHLPRTGAVLLAIDAVAMGRLFTPDRQASPIDMDEELLRASTRKLLDVAERRHASLVVFGHDGEQWRTLKKAPEYYD